jgi:hypothetical protein
MSHMVLLHRKGAGKKPGLFERRLGNENCRNRIGCNRIGA